MSSQVLEFPRCPFRNLLITRVFSCEFAREITRREGPDIGCGNAAANGECKRLFDSVKAAALTALELEDDLTKLPASMLTKIQHGTVTGLYQELHGETVASVDNIHAVVEEALRQYPKPEQLPCTELVRTISSVRLPRRRSR